MRGESARPEGTAVFGYLVCSDVAKEEPGPVREVLGRVPVWRLEPQAPAATGCLGSDHSRQRRGPTGHGGGVGSAIADTHSASVDQDTPHSWNCPRRSFGAKKFKCVTRAATRSYAWRRGAWRDTRCRRSAQRSALVGGIQAKRSLEEDFESSARFLSLRFLLTVEAPLFVALRTSPWFLVALEAPLLLVLRTLRL